MNKKARSFIANPLFFSGIIILLYFLSACIPGFSQPEGYQYYDSSHLPVVVIETGGAEIVPGEKITAWCKVIDNGPGKVNKITDPPTGYEGYIGIKIRGQSSQMFPKKSYSIELWSQPGIDTAASILGMPSEEDWVLHAHYTDKTMLRNALTFHLGEKMGGWQPRFRYCIVYVNGSYKGIYLLLESIKRGGDRVNINRLKPDEISGDDLTGGYIFKRDKNHDIPYWENFTIMPVLRYLNSGNYTFTYDYPDALEIVNEQKEYISQFLTDFENSLNSASFNDHESGYRKYISSASFIDFQIMQELSNNIDGYVFSTYFYKKKDSDGGKLYAGPLWDFDLAYGNVNYSQVCLSTTGWLFPHWDNKYAMHWWSRLMEDFGYARGFSARWKELRAGAFSNDSIISFIDNTVQYLGDEIDRNFIRWPIIGSYVWPNFYVGPTYNDEVIWLKNWISSRLGWMDSNISATWLSSVTDIQDNIVAFPNPAGDELNILINIVSVGTIEIEFYDLLGKKVLAIDHNPEISGFQEIKIDVSMLPAGNFILRASMKNRLIGSKKIVIMR